MVSVSLQNITKKWGKVVGLHPTDFKVESQEFVVFLGPSGCGKTTTMRIIAGLETPSSGEVLIDGKVVNRLEPKDRDVAMVFQNYGLYPNLTVFENIRFPLKIRKVERSLHDQRVRTVAEMVELTDLLDRKPKELSGGQRQRVALARAIVRKPKVFLMDEPLSNLDAKLRVSTRAQLKNLQHELKTTTIYVTHDQIEAMTLADRVFIMNRGRIQQIGTPEEIYDKPANTFVAGFIGNPSMNLIEGTLGENVIRVDGHAITGITHIPSRTSENVIFGIRAEDSYLCSPEEAQLSSSVYSFELLGEATMITLKIGNHFIAVRGKKDCRVAIGETVHVALNNSYHFFDCETGKHLGE